MSDRVRLNQLEYLNNRLRLNLIQLTLLASPSLDVDIVDEGDSCKV